VYMMNLEKEISECVHDELILFLKPCWLWDKLNDVEQQKLWKFLQENIIYHFCCPVAVLRFLPTNLETTYTSLLFSL
jgi:hypothetical protein